MRECMVNFSWHITKVCIGHWPSWEAICDQTFLIVGWNWLDLYPVCKIFLIFVYFGSPNYAITTSLIKQEWYLWHYCLSKIRLVINVLKQKKHCIVASTNHRGMSLHFQSYLSHLNQLSYLLQLVVQVHFFLQLHK